MQRDLKQVRALLGGVGYYLKFLRDLPKRIRPITSLLRKGVKFEFTSAMKVIVREILAPPILVFADWDAVVDGSRPFHVHCDACIDSFGAALEREQPDGSVRPIAYVSRATLHFEKRWTPVDLEAGSIVWALKRLRGYIWDTKFCIFSDRKALKSIGKVGDHNALVQRWFEFLTASDYTLEYRKGSANGKADSCRICQSLPRNTTALGLAASPPWKMAVSSSSGPGFRTRPSPIPGVGLSGLVPHPESAVLGGLPSAPSDFRKFRADGPRMRMDDISDPSGRFVARATAAVTTDDFRPGRGDFFPGADTAFASVLPYPLRAAGARQKPPLPR